MRIELARRIRALIVDEEGSAVLEFVALALPLFIPLFLFLNQYALQSDIESSLRTLSREMARAFVTSENDAVANRVTFEIFSKGAEILGYQDELTNGNLKYSFHCKNNPCISPDNEITITVQYLSAGRSISAIEYVSPWA